MPLRMGSLSAQRGARARCRLVDEPQDHRQLTSTGDGANWFAVSQVLEQFRRLDSNSGSGVVCGTGLPIREHTASTSCPARTKRSPPRRSQEPQHRPTPRRRDGRSPEFAAFELGHYRVDPPNGRDRTGITGSFVLRSRIVSLAADAPIEWRQPAPRTKRGWSAEHVADQPPSCRPQVFSALMTP